MSSNNPISETADTVAREQTTLGSQLRAAREQAGLSVEELARRLCMTVDKLEALERDDFARLAGATYVRGYVRNACKELGLDAAPLLDAFAQQVPAESTVHVPEVPRGAVMGRSGAQSEDGSLFRPAVLALVIAAAGGYWWFGLQGGAAPGAEPTVPAAEFAGAELNSERSFATEADTAIANDFAADDFEAEFESAGATESEPSEDDMAALSSLQETQPQAEAALEVAEEASVEPAVGFAEEAPEEAPEEPVTEPEMASAAVSELREAPAAPAAEMVSTSAAPAPALSLTFSEESWVEVVDATGNKLLAKLQPAGSTVEVTGEAPFSLMLGNAAATTVSYAGEVVDSKPLGNRRTRKLTVGG